MLDLHYALKRHVDTFAGVQQYAGEQGWYSIIDESVGNTLARRSKTGIPYDGVIARCTGKLARECGRLGLPVVNVWASSPVWQSVPGVLADMAAAGRLYAEHLLSRGFIRFASLRCAAARGDRGEQEAFTSTIAAAGFPCLESAIESVTAMSMGHSRKDERTIAAWMNRWEPPIGVFVGHDAYARLVVQMCHNRGWSVPADVAVAGGYNEEVYCDHLRPTLTSVERGFDRVGYEAARLLDRLMAGREPPPGPVLVPPRGLVVRESTDFFVVKDPLVAEALAFISANAHKPITPADVAHSVVMELRTLQRRFRAHLDQPIAAEIRRARIERAKRLLTETTRSMGEIARDVGFGKPMRLYEIFRRDVGVTPSQYRLERAPAADGGSRDRSLKRRSR
jgi:LacI family transcriptional regulator